MMNIVRKICLTIILISLSSVFYIVYNYFKFMRSYSVLDLGRWIKETMKFFVFVAIFGMIISFTLDVMSKIEKEKTMTRREWIG